MDNKQLTSFSIADEGSFVKYDNQRNDFTNYSDFSFWLLQFIAICITCRLIPHLRITSIIGPILTIICLTIVNLKLWDIALFFSLPDSLTVQTATLIIANGIIFWLLVKILPGIETEGFLPALIAPLVFTLTSLSVNYASTNIEWHKVFNYSFSILKETKQFLLTNNQEQETLTESSTAS